MPAARTAASSLSVLGRGILEDSQVHGAAISHRAREHKQEEIRESPERVPSLGLSPRIGVPNGRRLCSHGSLERTLDKYD